MEANQVAAVKIEKSFSASVDRVYHAWTDPENLKQWWKPMGNKLTEVVNQLEKGGRIEYKFEVEDGESLVITGEYIEVIPNVKLVYTWNWQKEDRPGKDGQYKLMVYFRSSRFGSSIEIFQENNNSPEYIYPHQPGWEEALKHLAEYVDSRDDPQSADAAIGHS